MPLLLNRMKDTLQIAKSSPLEANFSWDRLWIQTPLRNVAAITFTRRRIDLGQVRSLRLPDRSGITKDEGYLLKGCAAAWGRNLEKYFFWEMGGDLFTLQTRGAVIGLNTLRLALV